MRAASFPSPDVHRAPKKGCLRAVVLSRADGTKGAKRSQTEPGSHWIWRVRGASQNCCRGRRGADRQCRDRLAWVQRASRSCCLHPEDKRSWEGSEEVQGTTPASKARADLPCPARGQRAVGRKGTGLGCVRVGVPALASGHAAVSTSTVSSLSRGGSRAGAVAQLHPFWIRESPGDFFEPLNEVKGEGRRRLGARGASMSALQGAGPAPPFPKSWTHPISWRCRAPQGRSRL